MCWSLPCSLIHVMFIQRWRWNRLRAGIALLAFLNLSVVGSLVAGIMPTSGGVGLLVVLLLALVLAADVPNKIGSTPPAALTMRWGPGIWRGVKAPPTW
jgi:peptidoglycan/LPS O-acetylase OafA/YrhL